MKCIVAVLLILTGCDASGPSNAPPLGGVALPTDPETDGLSWQLIDRMEEHFGSRVGIIQDGEYEDGEHCLVTHEGQRYRVVYDLEKDVILNVSKAGTQETERAK